MRILYVAAILLLLVAMTPVGAAFDADIPWCHHQDVFFWNSSNDVGYRVMDNFPELNSQQTITSPLVSSTTGEKTLGVWLTPTGSLDSTTIAPGLWRFRVYAVASSDSGTTTLKYRIFNKSATGVVTWLFFGNAFSKDISAGTTPSEYLTSYARRNYTQFFPGDRLGIQINVSTDNPAARTVSVDVAGNTNASMVTIGYWQCGSGSSGNIFGSGTNAVINQSVAQDPTRGGSVPWDLWVISGIAGLTLIILALTRSKTQRLDYETNIVISVMAWPFCWYFAWGGLTSVDYIVGSGASANANLTAMITQHIIYTPWVLGLLGVFGSVFAVFVTTLLIAQYNLFKQREDEAVARENQRRMNEAQ